MMHLEKFKKNMKDILQASEAHTQAIEARDMIERAMEWLEELEDE